MLTIEIVAGTSLSYLFLFVLVLIIILTGVIKKGKPLQSDGREIIINVHKFFKDEFEALKNGEPTISVADIVQRTAAATGVSRASVYRLLNEKKNADDSGTKIVTPGKKRPNSTPKKTNIDSFTASAIKRTVYSLYKTSFVPSLLDIHKALREANLVEGSVWVVREVLKKMNFRYAKNNVGRKFLMEKPDIVAKRFYYLRKMQQLRASGRPIIYIDETWLNVNHTTGKVWLCDTPDGEVEIPMIVPLGKGQRFIIVHAGSSEGFIPNGLLYFRSKSTKDYHEEMDGTVFKDWFVNQLLPNIPQNSVIVMDNAPYHSVEINKAPVSSNLKHEMQAWLQEKHVEYDPKSTKVVLYDIIKFKKDRFRKYDIDTIAESAGHTVMRLPPYHCNFNAIELIWAQVKKDVAKHNITFKTSDVTELFQNALTKVTSENWRKACESVEKEEKFYWEKDGLMDEVIDRFIINLGDTDSEDEGNEQTATDNFTDIMEGIAPMPLTP